jgi:hypothetical protein
MSTQYNITIDLWSLFHLAEEVKLKTAILFQIDFCNRRNEKEAIQENWRNYLSNGKIDEVYQHELKEIEKVVSKKQIIWKIFSRELLFNIEIKKRKEVNDFKKIFYSYFLNCDYDILEKCLKTEFNNFFKKNNFAESHQEFIIKFDDKPDVLISEISSSKQKVKRFLGIEINKVHSLTDKEIGGSVAWNIYDKIEKKEWSRIKDKKGLIRFSSTRGFGKYYGGNLIYSVDLKKTEMSDLAKNLINQLEEKSKKVKLYDCEKVIIWNILLPDFWVYLCLEEDGSDKSWRKTLEEEVVRYFFLSKVLGYISLINKLEFFGMIVNYSAKNFGPCIDENGEVHRGWQSIEKGWFYIPITEINEIVKTKKWENNRQLKAMKKSFEEKYKKNPITYFDKIHYPINNLTFIMNKNKRKNPKY